MLDFAPTAPPRGFSIGVVDAWSVLCPSATSKAATGVEAFAASVADVSDRAMSTPNINRIEFATERPSTRFKVPPPPRPPGYPRRTNGPSPSPDGPISRAVHSVAVTLNPSSRTCQVPPSLLDACAGVTSRS